MAIELGGIYDSGDCARFYESECGCQSGIGTFRESIAGFGKLLGLPRCRDATCQKMRLEGFVAALAGIEDFPGMEWSFPCSPMDASATGEEAKVKIGDRG